MAKLAKRDLKFVIKCTHCMKDDFKLQDVDPNEAVKIYTDTPAKFKQYVTPAPDVTPC